MATILATIDVSDDGGSVTIRNLRDALSGLSDDTQKAAQQMNTASGGMAQGVKATTDALTNVVSAHAAAREQILLQAGALGVLMIELRKGATVTKEHADALQALQAQLKDSGLLTDAHKQKLSQLAAEMKVGTQVTGAHADAIGALTQGFAASVNGATAAGNSLKELIQQHTVSRQGIALHGQGLAVLSTQMKAGTTVTQLQADALKQLAKELQSSTLLTDVQKQRLNQLAAQMTAGTQVTGAHTKALGQLTTGFTNAANGATATGSAVESFSMKAAALAATLTLLAGGLFGLLKGSGELAARVEVLSTVMEVVGKNAHLSSIEMGVQVETVKKLGITTQEARDAVIKFAQAELQIADTAKVARAAQDLAVIAGINSSQAFGRLTQAIQSNSAMMLRSFGIVTGLEQIYREYGATIGKSWNKLDELEKKQAFVNKILSEGEKVAGAYEGAMQDVGKQMTSFARYTEEAQLALGQALLPAMGMLVGVATDLLKAFIALDPAWQRLITAIGAATAAMTLFLATLAGAKFLGILSLLEKIGPAFVAFKVAIAGGASAWAAFGAMVGGPVTAWLLVGAAAVAALTGAYIYLTGSVENAVDAIKTDIVEKQAAINKTDDLVDSINKMASEQFRTNEQVQAYNNKIAELRKAIPGAVGDIDDMTGRWKLNAGAIAEATAELRGQRDELLKTAQANLTSTMGEITNAEAKLAQLQIRLHRLPRQEPSEARTVEIAFVKDLIAVEDKRLAGLNKQRVAFVGLITDSNKAATAAIQANEAQQTAINSLILIAKDAGKQGVENQKLWEATMTKATAAGVADRLKLIMAGEKERLVMNEKTGDREKRMFELTAGEIEALASEALQKMGEYDKEQEKLAKKAAARAVQMAAAHKQGVEALLGIDPKLTEKFVQLNEALGKVTPGTTAWLDVLQRGKATLEAFGLQTDAVAKTYPQIIEGQKAMMAIFVADKIKPFVDELERGGLALQQLGGETISKLAQDMAALNSDAVYQQWADQRKAFNDQIAGMDRDLYEQQIVSKMTAVDQQIYHEGRRLAGIKKSLEEERIARQRQVDAEKKAINDRADAARIEIGERMRASEAIVLIKANEATALNALDNTIDVARKAAIQAGIDAAVQGQIKSNTALRTLQFAQIEALRQDGLKIAANHQKSVDEMNAASDAAYARQVAGSAANVKNIIREHDVLRKAVLQIWEGITTSAVDTLTSIITHTQSATDAIRGFWNNLKGSLKQTFADILKNWASTALQMAAQSGAAVGGVPVGGGVGGGVGTSLMGGATKAFMTGGWGGVKTYGAGMWAGAKAPFAAAHTLPAGEVGPVTSGGAFSGPMAAGAGAAAVGGIAGYAVGGMFKSRTGGALGGAAAGAAAGLVWGSIVPGIGNLAGLVIGGIAGLIGGMLSGGKNVRATEASRKQFVEAAGGIDELKKAAERTGFSIDKLMSTQKPKEFAAEVKKLGNAIQVKDMIDGLANAYGGMDKLQQKAKEAGVSLDGVFKGGISAADLAKEIQKVDDALRLQGGKDALVAIHGGMDRIKKLAGELGFDLQKLFDTKSIADFNNQLLEFNRLLELKKAKDALVEAAGGMDALSKKAQLVGFDISKAFEATTIEEFNAQIMGLNELLEEQRKRLAGLAIAAAGLKDMMAGMVMSAEMGLADVFKTFTKDQKKEFDEAFKAAQDKGFTGGPAKFLRTGTKDQFGEFGGLDKKQQAGFDKTIKESQAAFDRIGLVASAVFAGVLKETGDIVQAMNAIAEPLDEAIALQKELGLEANGSFKALMQFRQVITKNKDVATSLSGITQVLKGLTDAGMLSKDMFNTLGADAVAQYDKLKARGVSTNNAMLLMQPTLQSLWEAQQKFGYETDAATQKLIDQGIANGTVGANIQAVDKQILDILKLIAVALGAELPAALSKYKTTTEEAQKAAELGAKDTNAAIVATGSEIDIARDKWKAYRDKVGGYNTDIVNSTGNVVTGLGHVGSAADQARLKILQLRDEGVPALDKVGEAGTRAGKGASPRGVREISTQAREAIKVVKELATSGSEDLGDFEKSAEKVARAVKEMSAKDLGAFNTQPLADMAQSLSTYDKLIAKGFSSGESLRTQKEWLESVIQSYKDLGVPIDAMTQKLVDQAREQGILKVAATDATRTQLDLLGTVEEAVGGDLPASYRRLRDEMITAGEMGGIGFADGVRAGTDQARADLDKVATVQAERDLAAAGKGGASLGGPDLTAVADGVTRTAKELVLAAKAVGEALAVAGTEGGAALQDGITRGSIVAVELVSGLQRQAGDLEATLAKADYTSTFLTLQDAALEAATAVDTVTDGGLKDIPIKLLEASQATLAFSRTALASFGAVSGAVEQIRAESLTDTVQQVGTVGQAYHDLLGEIEAASQAGASVGTGLADGQIRAVAALDTLDGAVATVTQTLHTLTVDAARDFTALGQAGQVVGATIKKGLTVGTDGVSVAIALMANEVHQTLRTAGVKGGTAWQAGVVAAGDRAVALMTQQATSIGAALVQAGVDGGAGLHDGIAAGSVGSATVLSVVATQAQHLHDALFAAGAAGSVLQDGIADVSLRDLETSAVGLEQVFAHATFADPFLAMRDAALDAAAAVDHAAGAETALSLMAAHLQDTLVEAGAAGGALHTGIAEGSQQAGTTLFALAAQAADVQHALVAAGAAGGTVWQDLTDGATEAADAVEAVQTRASTLSTTIAGETYATSFEALRDVALKAASAVETVTDGGSGGGLKDIPIKLQEATQATRAFARDAISRFTAVGGAVDQITVSAELSRAPAQIGDVATAYASLLATMKATEQAGTDMGTGVTTGHEAAMGAVTALDARVRAVAGTLKTFAKGGAADLAALGQVGEMSGAALAEGVALGAKDTPASFARMADQVRQHLDVAGQKGGEALQHGLVAAGETAVRRMAQHADAIQQSFVKAGRAGGTGFRAGIVAGSVGSATALAAVAVQSQGVQGALVRAGRSGGSALRTGVATGVTQWMGTTNAQAREAIKTVKELEESVSRVVKKMSPKDLDQRMGKASGWLKDTYGEAQSLTRPARPAGQRPESTSSGQSTPSGESSSGGSANGGDGGKSFQIVYSPTLKIEVGVIDPEGAADAIRGLVIPPVRRELESNHDQFARFVAAKVKPFLTGVGPSGD